MPFEIMHFRESDKIIKEKRMEKDIKVTLEYIDDVLYGTIHRRELLRQSLEEMDWRENGTLNILDGRRYQYKGFKTWRCHRRVICQHMSSFWRVSFDCRWDLTRG